MACGRLTVKAARSQVNEGEYMRESRGRWGEQAAMEQGRSKQLDCWRFGSQKQFWMPRHLIADSGDT